jgi:hypothetical protein
MVDSDLWNAARQLLFFSEHFFLIFFMKKLKKEEFVSPHIALKIDF